MERGSWSYCINEKYNRITLLFTVITYSYQSTKNSMYPLLGFCIRGSPISALTPTKISVLDYNQIYLPVSIIDWLVGIRSFRPMTHSPEDVSPDF